MEENNNLFNENPTFAPDQEPFPATQPIEKAAEPYTDNFEPERTVPLTIIPEQEVPPVSASVPPVSASVPPVSASVPPVSASVPPVSASVPPVSAPVPPVSAPVPPVQPPFQQNPDFSRPSYYSPRPQSSAVPPYDPYAAPDTAAADSQKQKKTGLTVFCIALAVVVLFVGLFGGLSLYKKKAGGAAAQTNVSGTVNENAPQLELNQSPKSSAAAAGKALTPAQIYEKIAPSVVAVKLYSQKSQSAFTSGNAENTNGSAASEGTGVVWKVDDADTYILTCAHVVSEKNMTAVIETADGTRYDAEIVGYDARTDVGVLRVKQTGFTAAEFGDSDSLAVGDPIYAIGNPGGSEFFGSFTDGIVSAIGRTITSSIGYDMVCIQHNAAISPGNSGGPLLNEYGQVIGINSSKIAATEFEGISFAVPITQAKDIINKVTKYGYVPGRPKLGISYVANDASSINSIYSLAVQMKGLPSGSLVIAKIEKSSDLTNTDAKVGDMITAVNGKKMDKADVLLDAIANGKVGDTLKLSLFRIQIQNGRYTTSTLEVEVKLIEETNNQSDEEETTRALTYEDIFGF